MLGMDLLKVTRNDVVRTGLEIDGISLPRSAMWGATWRWRS
jgi:hypothetical protein